MKKGENGRQEASRLESAAFAPIGLWRVGFHFLDGFHDETVSPEPGN